MDQKDKGNPLSSESDLSVKLQNLLNVPSTNVNDANTARANPLYEGASGPNLSDNSLVQPLVKLNFRGGFNVGCPTERPINSSNQLLEKNLVKKELTYKTRPSSSTSSHDISGQVPFRQGNSNRDQYNKPQRPHKIGKENQSVDDPRENEKKSEYMNSRRDNSYELSQNILINSNLSSQTSRSFLSSPNTSSSSDFNSVVTSNGQRQIKFEDHNARKPKNDRQDKQHQQICNELHTLLTQSNCPYEIKNDFIDALVQSTFRIDECLNSYEYYLSLDSYVISTFRILHIETLQHKSSRFPNARFRCNMCNYHLDSLLATVHHILNERHAAMDQSRRLSFRARDLIPPCHAQFEALANLIKKVHFDIGMHSEERQIRNNVFTQIKDIILRLCRPDFIVSMYGSSACGFGLLNSDINLNVSLPINECFDFDNETLSGTQSESSADMVLKIVKALDRCKEFRNIKEKYSKKKSVVRFDYREPISEREYKCILFANNNTATRLAELLNEYNLLDNRVQPLVVAFRHFAQLCGIVNQDGCFLPPHCYTIMVIHYLQWARLLPNLHELPRLNLLKSYSTAKEVKGTGWQPQNDRRFDDLGSLWIGLLKYYAVRYEYKSQVISISHKEVSRRNEKCWNRWISIEDPIVPNSNLTRCTTNRTCDFIIDRIKIAYIYFNIPRCHVGPIYDGIIPDPCSDSRITWKNITSRILEHVEGCNAASGGEIKIVDPSPNTSYNAEKNSRFIQMDTYKIYDYDGNPMIYAVRTNKHDFARRVQNFLRLPQYHYVFSEEQFLDGAILPLACKSCGSEKHVRQDCPEETLPELVNVNWPSVRTLKKLLEAISKNYDAEGIQELEIQLRETILNEMEQTITKDFPSARLSLFGSTRNGFGLRSSDIDLCIIFQNISDVNDITGIDVADTLKKIATLLKNSGRIGDVVPITSAKIPIVKFRHKQYKLDGDLSLYNVLAVHNTNLLRTYCEIDERVKILGIFLKKVMKICDISDASKGSLSSYGYILMLIHFLQQTSTPVLPVLQMLGDKKNSGPLLRMEDKANVYFYDNVKNVANIWPVGKNTKDCAELWLNFISYYTETFDFENNVVSISQINMLTRKDKGWFTDAIAIEDPFDKSHNLGAGLSRRMSIYIRKTLIKLREFYYKPMNDFEEKNYDPYEYYLDGGISDGSPPIDHQCRYCRKIGHFQRNCPKLGRGDKNDEEDENEDSFSFSDEGPTIEKTTKEEISFPENQNIRKEKSKIAKPVNPIISKPTSIPAQIRNQSSVQFGPIQLGNLSSMVPPPNQNFSGPGFGSRPEVMNSPQFENMMNYGFQASAPGPQFFSSSMPSLNHNQFGSMSQVYPLPQTMTHGSNLSEISHPQVISSGLSNPHGNTNWNNPHFNQISPIHFGSSMLPGEDKTVTQMLERSEGISFSPRVKQKAEIIKYANNSSIAQKNQQQQPVYLIVPPPNSISGTIPRSQITCMPQFGSNGGVPSQFVSAGGVLPPQQFYSQTQNAPPPGFGPMNVPLLSSFSYPAPVMSSTVAGEERLRMSQRLDMASRMPIPSHYNPQMIANHVLGNGGIPNQVMQMSYSAAPMHYPMYSHPVNSNMVNSMGQPMMAVSASTQPTPFIYSQSSASGHSVHAQNLIYYSDPSMRSVEQSMYVSQNEMLNRGYNPNTPTNFPPPGFN